MCDDKDWKLLCIYYKSALVLYCEAVQPDIRYYLFQFSNIFSPNIYQNQSVKSDSTILLGLNVGLHFSPFLSCDHQELSSASIRNCEAECQQQIKDFTEHEKVVLEQVLHSQVSHFELA